MNKVQILVVVLLIIAIVFSAVSIALNFSLVDIKPNVSNQGAGDNSGEVRLEIPGTADNTGSVE